MDDIAYTKSADGTVHYDEVKDWNPINRNTGEATQVQKFFWMNLKGTPNPELTKVNKFGEVIEDKPGQLNLDLIENLRKSVDDDGIVDLDKISHQTVFGGRVHEALGEDASGIIADSLVANIVDDKSADYRKSLLGFLGHSKLETDKDLVAFARSGKLKEVLKKMIVIEKTPP